MIAGVCMVRDEADVIGYLVEHMLAEELDLVVVADNLSADDTRPILEAYRAAHPDRVQIVEDDEPGYYQADKMTVLAERVTAQGAEWVVPFDADEVWYSPDGQTVAATLRDADDVDVAQAPAYDHIARHDDVGDLANPFLRIRHRREDPQRLPKVAFRALPGAALHMGNHDVDRPGRREPLLEIRHFQYRSLEQMARKVRQGTAAYDAARLHAMYGTHWKELAALDDNALAARWDDLCSEDGLILDPAPWRSLCS